MVALFVVATIIVFLVIDYFVQRAAKRKAALAPAAHVSAKPRFVIPKGYFFGKGHTWVELLPDGLTRVGVDDFVQKIIGPVSAVELLPANTVVQKGDRLFTLRQGGKEVSFRAPISGKVVGINDDLVHSPGVVRKEPYKEGWVLLIEPTNLAADIKQLSIGNEAALWLREEIKRFRNFITAQTEVPAASGSALPAGVTLMDGGAPVNDVMEHSPQEIWQRFETDFLTAGNGKKE